VAERRPTARRRLAELGLLGRRQHRKTDEPESVRLRGAFEELGPLFAAFGQYLGTRVDLLPLASCATLAETPIPEGTDGEADATPSLSGVEIEARPIRRSFLHVWRRGVLDDDQNVVIKTVRSGAVAALEHQIDELPVLEMLQLGGPTEISDAVETYLVWLERQFDLRREFQGLRRLASETPIFDGLVVPRLWEEHSDGNTLVYSDPGGTVLEEVYDLADDDDANRDRARRLCSAWLQQALLESVLPEGPPGPNLTLLDDGRIAVTGGLFTSLGRKTRRSLLDALIATSRGDPDRACEHLFTACRADLDENDHDRIQVLFRQAEPFRDSGWSETYRGRRLADTLYVQWRLLRREEIDVPRSVLAYLQSLYQIEMCARRLAPDHDCFGDAVDDLTLVSAASRLREAFSVRRMRGVLEAAAPVVREMARRAETSADTDDEGRNTSKPKSATRRKWWSEIAGLLLLMVATAVSAHALRAAGIGNGWLEVGTTVFFIVLAGLALWRIWRHDR
jgi:predicted unusual protein kinase regulating ubiquinone biosynthesis (AarF/ABC1/UbiB family)